MEWKYEKLSKRLVISSVSLDSFLDALNSREKVEEWGPEDLRSVIPWGEHCDSIEIIEAPNLVVVPAGAFAWMPKLTAVDLSSAVVIGNSAFYKCPSLVSVTMPKVQIIGNSAFCGCASLVGTSGEKRLELKEARMISAYAFHRCKSLASVSFSREKKRTNAAGQLMSEGMPYLEFVGDGAFAECTSLQSFAYGGKNSRATFGENVFYKAGINPIDTAAYEVVQLGE